MTPDFDPTRVDWNNPDVEYMMKHFKMATANRDDEIAALTKSNEELRRAYSELEAKYEALAGMHSRPTGKGGAAASGAPAGAGADDGRREDPARQRSYNVRKYQGYPRPRPPQLRTRIPLRRGEPSGAGRPRQTTASAARAATRSPHPRPNTGRSRRIPRAPGGR